MSRLSPEAEQLVRAGRAVLRPSDADRERVFQGLLQQAGNLTKAGAGTTDRSLAPTASRLTLAKGAGVLAGLAFAGAGAFFALRPGAALDAVPAVPPQIAFVQSSEATPAVAMPSPPSSVAKQPSEPSPPVLSVEELAREVPPRAPSRRRSRARSDDQLAREVALLSRASSELHAGRPAAALEALSEHARTFPSGALVQERAAGRARALCALGRTKEAQVELAKLPPDSPHAARAAKACSAAPVEKR